MSRSVSRIAPPDTYRKQKILPLLDEFKLYEPECDTYDECKKLIIQKFIGIVNKIRTIENIGGLFGNGKYENIKDYIHLLSEIKDLKLEKYKDKLPKGQKKITDYFKSSTRPSTRPSIQYKEEQQRLEQEQHRKIIEERNKKN